MNEVCNLIEYCFPIMYVHNKNSHKSEWIDWILLTYLNKSKRKIDKLKQTIEIPHPT